MRPLGGRAPRGSGDGLSICREPHLQRANSSQTQDNPVMIEPRISAGFPSGEHYRAMAVKLRELARLCRFAYGRRELLKLAAVFNRRADHFDSRAL
jgi:hypothetical protein